MIILIPAATKMIMTGDHPEGMIPAEMRVYDPMWRNYQQTKEKPNHCLSFFGIYDLSLTQVCYVTERKEDDYFLKQIAAIVGVLGSRNTSEKNKC